MGKNPKKPWRINSNNKYVDVIKTIMSLSTGALILPVFFARNFLDVPKGTKLSDVFTCLIYIAWFLLGVSILGGIYYQYLSAKWIRIAWGKKAGLFGSKDTSEYIIEKNMEYSFWLTIFFFLSGVIITIIYFMNF